MQVEVQEVQEVQEILFYTSSLGCCLHIYSSCEHFSSL